MEVQEELISCFKFIGQTPSEHVINKSVELCATYKLSPDDFVDYWTAFNISHLKNAELNVENLLLMERKELSKISVKFGSSLFETPSKLHKQTISNEHVGGSEKKAGRKSTSDSKLTRDVNINEQNIQSSYSERNDARTVVCTFGNKTLTHDKQEQVQVSIYKGKDSLGTKQFKYLYGGVTVVADCRNMLIEELGHCIMKKSFLENPKEFDNNIASENVTYGQIRSDDFGRLTMNNVVLEGSRDFHNSKTIKLKLDKVRTGYSLFPGQVVAVTGMGIPGNSFVVHEFHTDASTDFITKEQNLTGYLQMVICAGPYTMCDNLLYEPLHDLLQYVIKIKPQVLILMGPFLDVTETMVKEMTETYEFYFNGLIDNVMTTLSELKIKVVLISSYLDAHHHPVYPTPAFITKRQYPNLLCVSDPCVLDINGVIVGATSNDTLFYLTREEISRNPQNNDRMSRLAMHLIDQRSFCPLYPVDSKLPVDYKSLTTEFNMDVVPHILVLPSALRCCVKNIKGCVMVNPERLSKKYVGGMFAVINVNPASGVGSIANDIYCEIIKI